MSYDAELNFLKKLFQKYHLQCLVLEKDSFSGWQVDRGLRTILGTDTEYQYAVWDLFDHFDSHTIYRATDRYHCAYTLLQLPDKDTTKILLAGPYLTMSISHQQLLEYAEEWNIAPHKFQQLENFYGSIPVLSGGSVILTALNTFAEQIWDAEDHLKVLDVDLALTEDIPLNTIDELPVHPDASELNMQMLEARYQFENELMRAVSLGLTHKAERIMNSFSELSFSRRLADPVRNLKNYAIIMNTLFRKAAEQGGVHPLYLDKTSSSFARKIEEITSTPAAQQLMEDIFKSYCRLVKNHSTKNYSLPVQRAIIYIDENLRGDLSLSTLARIQSINASYLSTLFKKETGSTITDYVNQKRIQLATKMLGTTKLQVQTIAQHCGYQDINYFSKIFKKYTNMTPLEYRKKDMRGTAK